MPFEKIHPILIDPGKRELEKEYETGTVARGNQHKWSLREHMNVYNNTLVFYFFPLVYCIAIVQPSSYHVFFTAYRVCEYSFISDREDIRGTKRC